MSDLLAHFTTWKDQATTEKTQLLQHHSSNVAQRSARFEHALAAESPPQQTAHAANKPEDFSAWDLLDMVNPLQHIPVVSDIYRAATGDTIRPEVQLVGSAAVGGVLGFASQLGKIIFEAETGTSVGTAIANAFTASDNARPMKTASAEREAAQPASFSNAAPFSPVIVSENTLPYPNVSGAFGGAIQPAYRAYQAPVAEPRFQRTL